MVGRCWVGGSLGDPDRLRTDPQWSPSSPVQLLFSSNNADCATAGAGDLACAIVNSGNTTAPWRYLEKNGPLTTSVNFSKGAFFEGGLNVSRLLGESGSSACISAFMAQTRTSQAIPAEL